MEERHLNRIDISDIKDPRLDVYARLSEPALLHFYEPSQGLFVAESPKVIKRALAAGYEAESMLVSENAVDAETRELFEMIGDIPVFMAPEDTLVKLTGFKLTRGVLCACRRRPLRSLCEILEGAKRVAVLEDVVNPTNVGAIMRSAAALGMDAVLLSPGCCDPLYRRAVRVSMGTVFQIPWTYIAEDGEKYRTEGIASLKANGFTTVAMALKPDTLNIDDPRVTGAEKLAIVLGTEGEGLTESTIEACDMTVCIPMMHGVDSLNVAAASAVAFWETGRSK